MKPATRLLLFYHYFFIFQSYSVEGHNIDAIKWKSDLLPQMSSIRALSQFHLLQLWLIPNVMTFDKTLWTYVAFSNLSCALLANKLLVRCSTCPLLFRNFLSELIDFLYNVTVSLYLSWDLSKIWCFFSRISQEHSNRKVFSPKFRKAQIMLTT